MDAPVTKEFPPSIFPLAVTVALETPLVMTALLPSRLPLAVIVTPVTAAFEFKLPARTLPLAVTVAVDTQRLAIAGIANSDVAVLADLPVLAPHYKCFPIASKLA